MDGKSGSTFITAIVNFVLNIKTVKLWDTLLGFLSIIALIILKKVSPRPGAQSWQAKVWQYIVRARNALVVAAGAIAAYCFYVRGLQPFALTGTIEGGLPDFGPPPFSTQVGNETLNFNQMLAVFGPEGFVMPLVAILESIAIAKAFAGSTSVDATQEMIAVGMCNLLASFCQSMPATGSFTRTALNHASGVVTPAGAIFKATLVLLSITLMSSTFYFIPRATLAGIIMVAMMSIMDLSIVPKLWRNSKLELCVYGVTVISGLTAGLEYGILAGALGDVARLLLRSARPSTHVELFKVGNQDCVCLTLIAHLSYSCAETLTVRLKRYIRQQPVVIVLDGRHLQSVDIGVAENLISVILDIEKKEHMVLLWNFSPKVQNLFEDLQPSVGRKFVSGPSIDQHVLGMQLLGNEMNHLATTMLN